MLPAAPSCPRRSRCQPPAAASTATHARWRPSRRHRHRSLKLVTALGEHSTRLGDCLDSGMLVQSSDGVAFRNDLARRRSPKRSSRCVGRRCTASPCRCSDRRLIRRGWRTTPKRPTTPTRLPNSLRSRREATARGAIVRPPSSTAEHSILRPSRPGDKADLGRYSYEVYLIDKFDEAIGGSARRCAAQTGDVVQEGDARGLSLQRCGGRRIDAGRQGRSRCAARDATKRPPAGRGTPLQRCWR